jgi:hypothetical protein
LRLFPPGAPFPSPSSARIAFTSREANALSLLATPQASPATTRKLRRSNSSFKGSISALSFFAFARDAPQPVSAAGEILLMRRIL